MGNGEEKIRKMKIIKPIILLNYFRKTGKMK